MPIKKNAPDQKLDPIVQAHREDERQRELNERVSKAQKRTPGQAKKAQYDKDRNKLTVDLPEEYTEAIRRIASFFDVPVSKVAGIIIAIGVGEFAKGKIDIASIRYASRIMGILYDFDLPDLPDIDTTIGKNDEKA